MKNYVIGIGDSIIIKLSADVIDYGYDRIAFVTNHHTVAEFNKWDYWYEETCEEKKECCCPCK